MTATASPAVADGTDDQAQGLYEAVALSLCSVDGAALPEVFNLTYETLSQPGKPAAIRIYRFPCGSTGLFAEHLYISHTAASGLQIIAFAQPDYDISCANGPTVGTVECTTRIDGFGTLLALPNSIFDPKTGTITTCQFWLPAPCPSVARVWVLQHGRYVLTEAEGLPSFTADPEGVAVP